MCDTDWKGESARHEVKRQHRKKKKSGCRAKNGLKEQEKRDVLERESERTRRDGRRGWKREIREGEGEKRKYSTSRVIILTLQNQLTDWQRCAHTHSPCECVCLCAQGHNSFQLQTHTGYNWQLQAILIDVTCISLSRSHTHTNTQSVQFNWQCVCVLWVTGG